MSNQEKRVTVRVEELVYSNMMTLNAQVELLEEKGVVTNLTGIFCTSRPENRGPITIKSNSEFEAG